MPTALPQDVKDFAVLLLEHTDNAMPKYRNYQKNDLYGARPGVSDRFLIKRSCWCDSIIGLGREALGISTDLWEFLCGDQVPDPVVATPESSQYIKKESTFKEEVSTQWRRPSAASPSEAHGTSLREDLTSDIETIWVTRSGEQRVYFSWLATMYQLIHRTKLRVFTATARESKEVQKHYLVQVFPENWNRA